MVANLFGILFAVRAVLHQSKPAVRTMPAGFPALAARLVLAPAHVAPVFAEISGVPTLLAVISQTAVRADPRAAAFLALLLPTAVEADRRAAAFLALLFPTAVEADRRAVAFLAFRSFPAVRADRRAAAFLAARPPPAVRALRGAAGGFSRTCVLWALRALQ